MTMQDEEFAVSPPEPSRVDPEYWEGVRQQAREEVERLREEESPKKVTFNLSWEDRFVVDGALHEAREHTGTNRNARALAHVCMDYMKHGPKIRAMESAAEKSEIKRMRLEEIMKQVGPSEAMATFNRVFPAHAVLDYPK